MIEISKLCKSYKNKEVLKGIDLSINKGEVIGLVGKNGVGKTTLMKCIAKQLIPTTGAVFVDGKDMSMYASCPRNIGFLMNPVFFEHLNAYDNLKFYLKINGKGQYIDNIDDVLRDVDLYEARTQNPKFFSFGMKQRLGLAMCLIDRPDYLLLDEPFVGLDPDGLKDFICLIKTLCQKRNVAVLISSHQLSELRNVCQTFLMMVEGTLKRISIDELDEWGSLL